MPRVISKILGPLRLRPAIEIDLQWPEFLQALSYIYRDAPQTASWPALPSLRFCSVRTGFNLLLKNLAPEPGSEMIMSAVNIRDMQKIATVRGLKIRYVDLNPVTGAINSEKLAALIDEKTKVILVAQLLGMKHDLQAVRQLIGDRDILLVEDCAQCFDGEYTGANAADVSMFSFGPIKFQTALCGAVFIVRNRHLLHRMQQQVGQLPLAANTWFVKRLVKYSLLKLISSRPLFGLLDLCFQLVRKNTDEIIYRWSRGFGQRNLDQKMNMQLPPAADRFLSHKLSLEKGRIHRRIPKSEWVRYQHAAVSDETLRQMRRRGEAVSNRAGSLCCLGDQPDLPGAEAFLQNLLLSNSRKR